MNGWGLVFLAPFIALIFVDPQYMIPAFIGLVVFTGVAIWIFEKVIGPKK